MPLNLASPGVLIREVDLTVGRIDPVSPSVGALAAPFAQGPVGEPTLIESENDLLNTFGKPYDADKHYEHWMVASSYLAYGGSLQIVRTDDDDLKNGMIGAASSVKIRSLQHYNELGYAENTITDVTFAAKNPGSWGNGLRVAMIDSRADQVLSGITTTALSELMVVGMGVTQAISSTVPLSDGTTSTLDGYLKGVITEVTDQTKVSVKVLSHVSASGTETNVDYEHLGVYRFSDTGTLGFTAENSQSLGGVGSTTYTTETDWFDSQQITLGSGTIVNWNTLAERPQTTEFGEERGARFDEMHVIVYDDDGAITGNTGTILEKHLGLSKAKDATFSSGSPSYWRKFLAESSEYIFGGSAPVGVSSIAYQAGTFERVTDFGWDQNAQGISFAAIGNSNSVMTKGVNYDGTADLTASGALGNTLGGIIAGYNVFVNEEDTDVDFLLMGSAAHSKVEAQALANKLIAVAEARQDAIAFISPYRAAAITDTSSQTSATINDIDTITNNVLSFYSSVTSSTYGVLDSGYKYMYDRFNDTFRYVPLNGDIAGTCARVDANSFPWFSPAGSDRGAILNAVKLAYNPGKAQRDKLYGQRINPVITSRGQGTILFGDKTSYGKASAFDRINVRRLFIYLENAISAAARDQLFEFNDEITRTNFVNIVEPFLRDVQSKRGLFDFVVICDQTNNTPAVIDNNEFVADIYIKPAKSINFIGLTFIATRTGVSFEEVIGNV
jgi:hypothetical protein|tara:strand:- start:664 stop:2847 length:2184 start_codon:yes stop_codon:yes gene_type:complete